VLRSLHRRKVLLAMAQKEHHAAASPQLRILGEFHLSSIAGASKLQRKRLTSEQQAPRR
jgi:hypothetical protein